MLQDETAHHLMRWVSGMISCALALFVCGCVYFSEHTLPGACVSDLGSPIRNFCVVSPEALWRGEHPTSADAKRLPRGPLYVHEPTVKALSTSAPCDRC